MMPAKGNGREAAAVQCRTQERWRDKLDERLMETSTILNLTR